MEPQPNLLFLMPDQMRWDAMSCVSGWVDTPNLDRIAAEGVRFHHAYTNSPVCIPARAALVTGRYAHQTGVWGNSSGMLSYSERTWMQSVRNAGYATSLFGKSHLHRHEGDLRDREHVMHEWGFDEVDEIGGPRAMTRVSCRLTDLWREAGVFEAYMEDMESRFADKPWVVRPSPLPLELYPDVYVARRAGEHLRAYDGDRPWMCWVGFSGPHEPWDTPHPYAGTVDPASMPPPLRAEQGAADRPRGSLDRREQNDLDPDEVAALRADYAAQMKLIDDQVGELLRVIEDRGELDRTVIVLASDHGEMNGDFDLLYKQNFLNPAARIPLVVRIPGGRSGWVCDDPIELMDVGATLVELAGGEQLPTSQARSVATRVLGGRKRGRKSALSEHAREVMVATREWKMAVNSWGAPYLLYDLESDPDELRNLAGLPEYAEQTSQMQDMMLRRLVRSFSSP
ncbi:MAG TPA: sulfatase-like hydrolase/transferase [Nocardioides sp.]|nr:sulfatase-like hydrolase/transferase [Nocardioides sp.]